MNNPNPLLRFALPVFLIAACGLLSGCDREATTAGAEKREFAVRGIVRGLPPDPNTIEVEHENIPGFMAAMTMPFVLKNPADKRTLKPGDAISFRLTVTSEDSWIDEIRKIDQSEVNIPLAKPLTPTPAASAPRLRAGDSLPPFELTDHTGSTISAETFRGHPLVLTFIFTRCPIPNFCPKLTHSFSVLVRPEEGTISHGLATALVNRKRRIVEIWRGNGWKPAEVIEAVNTTL